MRITPVSLLGLLLLVGLAALAARAGDRTVRRALLQGRASVPTPPIPPVPEPGGNAITTPKTVLGKMLFWEQQLSSDDTMACGTCHAPATGGADARAGWHPGRDRTFGTPDDVHGSPSFVWRDERNERLRSTIFGAKPQVTPRVAPSVLGAAFAPALFRDGRAAARFVDPAGEFTLERGAALESQALEGILGVDEMSYRGRTWPDVVRKLGAVTPMARAGRLTPDIADALARAPTYAQLFAAAFGDARITPGRIALALATYERTLVPDQTPWDALVAGDEDALSKRARRGWRAFQASGCVACHVPPLFTDHTFRNVGVGPLEGDPGRAGVTGDPADRGKFRVPSLRNVGLRKRFMHNGLLRSFDDVLKHYRHAPSSQAVDPAVRGGVVVYPGIESFLDGALDDPRARDERPPFDHPLLAR